MGKYSFIIHISRQFIITLSFLFFVMPLYGFSRQGIRSVCVHKNDNLAKVLSGENTKYIIRHDHDISTYLGGVVIGENSILEFRGGSLNNGRITFNNTKVVSRRKRVLYNNKYIGTIDVETACPEWFGAKGDGVTDDTKAIQDAIDVSNSVTGSSGKAYAVRTNSPNKHCLVVKRDSQVLDIHLKDVNEYISSDYRGKGIIFIDNKNGFSFSGSISSINENLPVSAKTGMTLEEGRAGIVCYGDCGDLNINLTCSNLYCGVFHGTFMYDEYLYRNGMIGLNNSKIKVKANRVAYPVALNYANHCEIDVHGEHMHRCIFLCGDNNNVNAQGRNYYATAAPAHIILFSNVLKNGKGEYKIVTCNHNNVTYKQLERETKNLNDGAVFQFQGLGLNLNNKIPHEDYAFVDNTVNLYCCKLESKNMQLLYKSFASNWVYDKNVGVECVFNIYGDISSYLSYASFEFYADTEDKITVNNYTNQQLVYTFSYRGNPKSIYNIYGDSRSRAFGTKEYPFRGTLRAKGKHVYVNTTTGSPDIMGHIYAEGDYLKVIQDKKNHARNVHIKKTLDNN